MDLNRVSNFHNIVERYTEKGTNASTRVRVGTNNGKIRLGIGSGTGKAFGASRTVKQLAHTLSQLNKQKEDKISYEGKVLKDFFAKHVGDDFTKHLDKKNVFKGEMTFENLQTISAALKQTADGPQEQAQPQATVGANKHPEPSTKRSSAKTVLNKTSPRKLAQKNWVKKQAGGGKVDGANPPLGETSKSFLSGQRAVQNYNDLSEEDKASLKNIINDKNNSLADDHQRLNAAKKTFKSSAQQKLEDHAKSFPNLMDFAKSAQSKGSLQTKLSEQAKETILNKIDDLRRLVQELEEKHNDLEGEAKEKLEAWIENVEGLRKAWVETDYMNLNPKKLDFVDQFCKSARDSFDRYKQLALDVNNKEKQSAERNALDDTPIDRLLNDTGFSDATKSFLLNELARFSHSHAGLKGFEKYESFIYHLDGIDTSIAEEQKKKPIANEPPQALSAKKVRKNTKANAGWNKGVLPYQTVVANLLAKPNNRHDLELSLMAYAKKKNDVLQLVSAKLFGDGRGGESGMLNIYTKDPQFSLAFEPVKRVIEEKIAPNLLNQSLSLNDMETIDRRITEYVVSKEATLFTDLKFKGQDEDLKNLLASKIKQLSPKQKGSEELAQKMTADWYGYREQAGVQSLMTEAQINGFLDHLAEKYKA
jgi:hypothetical protein